MYESAAGDAVHAVSCGCGCLVNVELRQLRYFIAVAEELHFRRAAERLYVSQPAISRQIAQLEHRIGVRLFERDRRRVELTPAGSVFLRNLREALVQLERSLANARWVGQKADLPSPADVRPADVRTLHQSSTPSAIAFPTASARRMLRRRSRNKSAVVADAR